MGKRIIRYELTFDGELQRVGMLNGLDDIGLSLRVERQVLTMFEGLPCPSLPPQARVSFWFTKKGADRFAFAISNLRAAIGEKGWGIVSFSYDLGRVPEDAILYQDDLQVAIKHNVINMEALYDKVH